MKKCENCKGTGKIKGTCFIGEEPDCPFCNGTGYVSDGETYIRSN